MHQSTRALRARLANRFALRQRFMHGVMTPEAVEEFAQHVVGVIGDVLDSHRFERTDIPGSAHVLELGSRIQSPERYSEFRNTEVGSYFLGIIEPLQDAINDEWLPLELFGLPIEAARDFILRVYTETMSQGLTASVPVLRAYYSELRNES